VEKGTLVEFRTNGDRRLGVIDRPEGKKHFIAIDRNGTAHTVHPRDIEFVIGEGGFTPQKINPFWQSVEPLLDPSSLEVAWEFVADEGTPVTVEALADLLFSETGAIARYATHCLLSQDKLYFKRKGEQYEPRPPAQIAELKHQQEATERRAQEAAAFQQKLRAALQRESIVWEKGERQRLESLERLVLQGEEAPDKNTAFELLGGLARPRNDGGAFQLLVDLGWWSRHENLFLRRSQIPQQFPAEVLALAAALLAQPPADPTPRQDLTHLHVYTIDDESTREIDDGLSLEPLADGGVRLWIHIADPSRWLTLGDPLDREARRRGTTVYLPTGPIPMFPPELATGPMSLVQGQTVCALSFSAVLDDQGAAIATAIVPSIIRPDYRLTYDDADEMLQMDIEAALSTLDTQARLRTRWRQGQGAIQIDLPEANIKVNAQDDRQLTLELIDESPSRRLVAEMMILAGEIGARYAQEHNLPISFRCQAQPELPPPETLEKYPAGPSRDFALCRCMAKGEASVHPLRHAGLGLNTYAQVTSPIRRYGDLLAHIQIKAHLRGETPPLTHEELAQLLNALEPAIAEANQVERQTNRYWTLEFLRRHAGETWRAMLLDWLREHERLGLILLEDVGIKLPMRFERAINPGDGLWVRVEGVDPRQDKITFVEVAPETLDIPASGSAK